MMRLLKIALKKYHLNRFFAKYVRDNSVIQKDILKTIEIRGCEVKPDTLFQKFYHLMMYYPEFALIFFWRIGMLHSKVSKLFMHDFNCKIFGSTNIKGGLHCFHPFGTVINAKDIGENFQFRNALTIGNKNNDNSKLPTIGDNVTVGVNVVIIGDIKIGNNVEIGASSVVVKDVQDNAVVAGNPAKTIRMKNG